VNTSYPFRKIRLIVSLIIVCCLSLWASACVTTEETHEPDEPRNSAASPHSGSSPMTNTSPTRYPPADWDRKPDGPEWTRFAHTAISELGSELLASNPRDVGDYCPSYHRLNQDQRRAFWVYLLSRLARFESNQDPGVRYTESFDDSRGNPVISRGLLQISMESANGYGCGIEDAMELHDPETNIRCGVRILNRWVAERDGVIAARTDGGWRGAARYWSPFRNDTKRSQIASATAAQGYCQ
jgi:hypothetical protein